MHEVMKTVLMLSLSGTLLMGILFLFRPLYRERLSRRWQYYIWLVVIARLLVPWTLETIPVGGNGLAAGQKMIQGAYQFMEGQAEFLMHIDPEQAGNTNRNEEMEIIGNSRGTEQEVDTGDSGGLGQETDSGNSGSILIKYLPMVWFLTAMLLLIRKITIYQSFLKYIRAGSRAVDDINLLEHVGNMMEQERIRGSVEICTNSLISSPLLVGVFRPCIVLPASEYFLSEKGFHYTVMHEMAHYRRWDLIYKWLMQVTLCLHWFNPFVYLMEREVSRACELSCDEAVIRKLDHAARKEYGSTLLNAMAGGTYSGPAVSVSFNEGKELLKGRLDAIMNYKKKSAATAAAAVAVACLFAAGAASIGIYKTPAAAVCERKSADTAKQDELTITCEGSGMYYVFAAGADASDQPSGSVTDGCIGIDYVSRDGYASIGPFEHKKTLVKDVKSQCSYERKHGRGTQEEYDAFLYTAQEIERISKTGSDKFPKLNKNSITLSEGSTASLKMSWVKKTPAWSSGSSNIAAVDQNGTVTAKKAGKTKIYAKIGRITYICNVKVVKKAASKQDYAKDYAGCGITKKNGSYYYRGDRVRIFMDLRADGSFVIFHYDQKGTIDLRLKRAEDGSIFKVEGIMPEEADEIREELELADYAGIDSIGADHSNTDSIDPADVKAENLALRNAGSKKADAGADVKITRMTKEEASKSIKKALQSCSSNQWYLIRRNKKQYIYYNGLSSDYAFKPILGTGSLQINITDLGRQSACYVLLKIGQDVPVTISYNGRQVAYEKLAV